MGNPVLIYSNGTVALKICVIIRLEFLFHRCHKVFLFSVEPRNGHRRHLWTGRQLRMSTRGPEDGGPAGASEKKC